MGETRRLGGDGEGMGKDTQKKAARAEARAALCQSRVMG